MALALLSMLSTLAPAFAQDRPSAVADRGDFRVRYESPRTQALRKYEQLFRSAGTIELSAAAINDELALPADIDVTMRECGEANAYFDPSRNAIDLCYELAADLDRLFQDDAESDEDLNDLILTGMDFFFHHETGHALVEIMELPITGKEEDAVDDLATLVYIRSDDAGVALVAADHFYRSGLEELEASASVDDLPYFDEHSLSLQRYYGIACLVYGSDADAQQDVLEENPELADRNCEGEFSQKDNAWAKLLERYLKPEPPAAGGR